MNICLRYVCLRVCLRVKEKKIGEKECIWNLEHLEKKYKKLY